MNAAMLCTRDVATCSTRMSVVEAAARMRDAHAGDLVVVREREGRCEPVGMLTDRDIVLAVVGPDAQPASLFVGEIGGAARRLPLWWCVSGGVSRLSREGLLLHFDGLAGQMSASTSPVRNSAG